MNRVKTVNGKSDLLQVVAAGRPIGGLSHSLNRGQQQTDQNSDDRDHDQQLDQGETALFAGALTDFSDWSGNGDFNHTVYLGEFCELGWRDRNTALARKAERQPAKGGRATQ